MTEQELRMLVRQVIGRVQAGHTAPSHLAPSDAPPHRALLAPSHPLHASHALFLVPDGSDADGPCIIEPTVSCSHCGYCKSLGH